MDWTRMMIGVVLLLTPPQGIQGASDALPVNCPQDNSICNVENLRFAFTKDNSDAKMLRMYLMKPNTNSDAKYEGYYTFIQEEGDSDLCWKSTNLSDAKPVNGVKGIMGTIIAILLVTIIASTLVFIYLNGQKSVG